MSSWGVSPEEKLRAFPCDRFVKDFDASIYRGVSIQTPPSVVFRWLCQMRVAPYSYDWIDNRGRKSPRVLTQGVERLEHGQIMLGFELVEFEQDQHLTLQGGSPFLGYGVGSYMIVPISKDTCRLLVKMVIKYPKGPRGLVARLIMPWGDMIMMRRQLLNFKELSEETYRNSTVSNDSTSLGPAGGLLSEERHVLK